MDMFLITVFTPTYNRAKLLQRLFASLQKQTYQNFEWVIVDDGSIDNTEEVVDKMKLETKNFKITYAKQKNQGKHIAINKGLDIAKGDYFFIVDSDDRLPEKSLEIINSKAEKIHLKKEIAGVVGLKCHFGGTPVGTNLLQNELICSLFNYRYKYNHKGDRAEVIKTTIFKKYLFPQYQQEKFIPESIVWNRIAKKYKLLYFPENVYECEYLDDGLSSKSVQLRRENPIGALNLYAELGNSRALKIVYRVKAYVNYWRFFFSKSFSSEQKRIIPKTPWFTYLFIPIGYFLNWSDRKKQY